METLSPNIFIILAKVLFIEFFYEKVIFLVINITENSKKNNYKIIN